MSTDLAKTLAGAKTGDYRLYSSPTGASYVVLVSNVVPEEARSFEDSREAIAKTVFAKRFDAAMKEWSAKLRSAYPVEVFISRLGR